jgi:hypothetical protein
MVAGTFSGMELFGSSFGDSGGEFCSAVGSSSGTGLLKLSSVVSDGGICWEIESSSQS